MGSTPTPLAPPSASSTASALASRLASPLMPWLGRWADVHDHDYIMSKKVKFTV